MIYTKSSKLLIILLALCFFNLVVLTDFLKASGLEDNGYLKIEVRHNGLEVQLDGQTIGYTPLSTVAIPVGKHKISVEHFDPGNWLAKPWQKDITITKGDTVFLSVEFTKNLSINSSPYGAEVFTENELIGKTPLFYEIKEGEKKQITLKKDGYQDTTFTINFSDFEKVYVQLNKVGVAKANNLDIDEGFNVEKRSSYKNKFLWTLGVSALSGALALYFRTQADDKYNRYKNTGDPDSFNKLYDDAKRFDKYAAISYATFQVSFVFSFYFFFSYKNQ